LELWTLLNFVHPDFFTDSSLFPEDDLESLEKDVIKEMRSLITPYLLRRSLLDVERDIVPKEERLIFVMPTTTQREMFRLTLLHELWRVKKTENFDSQTEANSLGKICNHPFLISEAEGFLANKLQLSRLDLLVSVSAKFILLDRILPHFKRNGRSVLIFSQRVKILKMLKTYCQLKKYTHELLIGTLTDIEKKAAITKFCDEESNVFIFLISTRSGAEGLNLTRVSITIIFDPDWNPQNDLQALWRCHRIGQTPKVDVLRLITYGTYEHAIYQRAQKKLKLWDTLLGPQTAEEEVGIVVKPEIKRPAFDSMIKPIIRQDSTEISDFTSTEINPVDEEDLEVHKEIVVQPPDLENDDFQPLPNDTFESVLDRCTTIVRDVTMESHHHHFNPVDISFNKTDEEFLQMFPVDPAIQALQQKKKLKPVSPKIVIDPKLSKQIIRSIELHGYGEWETITEQIKVCPLDQIIKFCQAAVILHFRACEPDRILNYPILMHIVLNDVKLDDYRILMIRDQCEWHNVFGKSRFQSRVAKFKTAKL
jgi:hypothetical protein